MKVSVIIPCHNHGMYLARAIRSTLDQSMPRSDYEVIVVDDGSEDCTRTVMESHGSLIKPIYFDKNQGLGHARNEAIRVALGQFIVCLDADDYFDQSLLQIESLFLLRNADWDAVSCDYYIINKNEEHIERVNGLENPVACGIMFRKEHLVEIGLYDETFRAREEEDLRHRFLQHFSIHHIPLPLYRYRRHESNLTNDDVMMENHREKLAEKHCNGEGAGKAPERRDEDFPACRGSNRPDRHPQHKGQQLGDDTI